MNKTLALLIFFWGHSSFSQSSLTKASTLPSTEQLSNNCDCNAAIISIKNELIAIFHKREESDSRTEDVKARIELLEQVSTVCSFVYQDLPNLQECENQAEKEDVVKDLDIILRVLEMQQIPCE